MRSDTTLETRDTDDDAAAAPASPALPALDLDADDYLSALDGIDISEAQKRELLEILWSIMRSFVHYGFDISLIDPCGQIFGDFNAAADDGAATVESSLSNPTEMPSTGTDKDHP